MSLERYANNHNLTREVRSIRKPYQSPVGAFASLLISDAETELISLDRGGNSPLSSVLTLDRPFNLKRRDPVYTKKIESLIYWGNAVISLEDIIRTGKYDHGEYIERLNGSIGKYDGSEVAEDYSIIEYSDLDLRLLTENAQDDPTFSLFITDCSILVPQPITDLWIKKDIIRPIVDMMPSYKIAAKKLLVREVDPKDTYDNQRIILREFDNDYMNFVDGLKVIKRS